MKVYANRFATLALLSLYTFSQLSLLIGCIGCTVRPVYYLWVFLLCISTWLTTTTRRGLWIGMPISALLLFFAYRFFDPNLLLQLNDVFDRLTGAYMEQIAYPGEAYSYLSTASDHSLLFVFLAYLLASYMGAAITSRSGRIGLAFLGSIPFFAACLAVTVRPPALAVFGMLLFWFLLAVGGNHYDENSNAYVSVIGSLFPLTLLLSLLLLYINPDNYEYTPNRMDLSVEFDRLIQNMDEWLNERLSGERLSNSSTQSDADIEDDEAQLPEGHTNTLWQTGQGDLDLTQHFAPEDLETIYLRVRAEHSGSLYLRAVSYGDYIGTGWKRAEEDTPLSSLNFTAQAIAATDGSEQSLRIQSLGESAYRYLPYFCTEADHYDSFVPSDLQSGYSSTYFAFPQSFSTLTLPPSLSSTELTYRTYAHEYYTRLPEATRTELLHLCSEVGLAPGMEDLIRQVAAYVQSSGTYALETDAYPSGDYALYFLTTAHQGYCIHFATAAAALYRSLGIPARITEGFLLETKGGEFIAVKGSNAHAWVEVYQDGLGWLPVEVTGQSGLESNALGAGDIQPQTQGVSESQPTAQGDISGQEDSNSLSVGVVTQPSPERVANHSPLSSVGRLLRIILLLLLLLALIPLRRFVILLMRNQSYAQSDTRKAVIAMYVTAQKLVPWGEEIPEFLASCAEKAMFSHHEIGIDEVERCRDELTIHLKTYYLKLNPWARFRFKYFHVLL